MTSLAWVAAVSSAALVAAVAAAWIGWRRSSDDERRLIKRAARLSLKAKLRLARAMFGDSRIPLAVRAIPPALVLYLAMPLDLVPDFVPVLGQLDDVLVLIVAVSLIFRFVPRGLLIEHLDALEKPL
jgi:uncharacterized membrane protein YkvA (DUF1232 family)